MEKLILIKLGGSLITDKNKSYTAKPRIISRLAKEIKKAHLRGHRIIISHGSGSFGHTLANQYQTANGIKSRKDIRGLCLVQQDAIAINRIINKIFLKNKLDCLSFFPSSFSFSQNKKLKTIYLEPIIAALKMEIIPIVFGDIIFNKINIEELWNQHVRQNAIATLMLTTSPMPSSKGIVKMEGIKILKFEQKPKHSDIYIGFSSMFVAEPEILGYRGHSLECDIFPKLAEKGLLQGHLSSEKEVHIHTKEDIRKYC